MKNQPENHLDILFENRNKSYGAYELRINYEKRLARALGGAMLGLFLLFIIPVLVSKLLVEDISIKGKIVEVTIDLNHAFDFEKSKVAASMNATAPLKQVVKENFQIVKNEEVLENPEVQKQETEVSPLPENTGNESGEMSATAVGHADTENEFSTEPMNAALADEAPSFPGGSQALYQFLSKSIRYPAVAREAEVEGAVYASFIVNEKGKIEKIIIVREPGMGLGAEVIRVLNSMPDWSPGKYKGEAVKTIYSLPVRFSLANG